MCNTYKMVLLFALIITFHNTCITFSDLHSFITTSTGQVQLLNQFQVIQQWYKSSEVSIADLSMTSTHCNLNKINNPLKCYWLKLNSIKILYKTHACINWHTENNLYASPFSNPWVTMVLTVTRFSFTKGVRR